MVVSTILLVWDIVNKYDRSLKFTFTFDPGYSWLPFSIRAADFLADWIRFKSIAAVIN